MSGREGKACGAKWRCLAADLSDMEGNDQYNHAPPHISEETNINKRYVCTFPRFFWKSETASKI